MTRQTNSPFLYCQHLILNSTVTYGAEKSLEPEVQPTPRADSRKAVYHTNKLKRAMSYDPYEEEWFTVKIYDSTKADQDFMSHVLNRKQLLGKG